MLLGLQLGGRHVEFLIYSSSNITESHAVWLSARLAPEDSAMRIREEIGAVAHENEPAGKIMKRYGQALSDTVHAAW
ncbi:MAG: hypothetical protein MHM6MM_009473, partial [Cercozoa sp. M6MM]